MEEAAMPPWDRCLLFVAFLFFSFCSFLFLFPGRKTQIVEAHKQPCLFVFPVLFLFSLFLFFFISKDIRRGMRKSEGENEWNNEWNAWSYMFVLLKNVKWSHSKCFSSGKATWKMSKFCLLQSLPSLNVKWIRKEKVSGNVGAVRGGGFACEWDESLKNRKQQGLWRDATRSLPCPFSQARS